MELGGCVVDEHSPNRRCLDCNHAWHKPDQARAAIDQARHVLSIVSMEIEKFRHMFDYAIAQYGSACLKYGAAGFTDASAYTHMLTAYAGVRSNWDLLGCIAQGMQDQAPQLAEVLSSYKEEVEASILSAVANFGCCCIAQGSNDIEGLTFPTLNYEYAIPLWHKILWHLL